MGPKELVTRYRLVSDQVDEDQVATILEELSRALHSTSAGAVVELGCYLGTTSLFIRRLLDQQAANRPFHVYDSFAGLPPKTGADDSTAGEQFQGGELSVSKKQFTQQFKKAGLALPVIHKGWFAELTADDVPDDIAFAFLDGDFYESIRDSLRLVMPRLVPGATLVIDDYSREALPGVAKAVREYLPPALYSRLRTVHNLGIINI